VTEHRDFNLRPHQRGEERTDPRNVVIPIVEEEASVHTRRREGESVRLRKTAAAHEETLRVPVTSEHVDVQRVAVNAPVDGPVEPWRDGETLVIPVMEQVPVVRMQWVVREEIRVTRSIRRTEHQKKIWLEREQITVDRTETPPERGDGRQHERGR
jgi:stress response protein YsnF